MGAALSHCGVFVTRQRPCGLSLTTVVYVYVNVVHAQTQAMDSGVQMVSMEGGMVPPAFSYPPPPTYVATVYADRGDGDDDNTNEPEPVTGVPVPGYPVSSTGAPFSPSEAMMHNLNAPLGFHQTAPPGGNTSGGCS